MLVLVLATLFACGLFGQQPFNVGTMLKISRISEPVISPDGRTVAFTVQTIDVDKNTKPKQIYTVALSGGFPRQVTHDGTDNERPRWSPDSRTIYYVSDRDGSSQVWSMSPDGSGARQVTHLSTEANGILVAPDSKKIVFLSNVYPDCGADDGCNKIKIEDEKKSKVKARIYTSLLYRHWNEWQVKRRQHLMVINTDGTDVKDLTPGMHDVPPFTLAAPDGYAISPDSNEVAFTMNVDANLAISTNSDIYTVPIGGGEPKKITTGPGAEDAPLYSPDGSYLAFRSQSRAGYESDRFRLMVFERASGRTTDLSEGLDRWVEGMTWSPDSTRLFFTMEDRGRTGLQMIGVKGGGLRPVISGASSLDDVQFNSDGSTLIYTEQSGSRPTEIYRASSTGGSGVALTHLNDSLLASTTLTPLDDDWVDNADKTRVHYFVVKPPGFTESRKYPVLFLIHGGPQGAWGESWSYRWNPQVFASAGYLVVMPNPRGSTGYGQKFIDDINDDWGGKVYNDIMAVVDHVALLPYVDPDRMAAAGGSYGGYMIDWMLGHTTRFKAMVTHDGVFDLRSEAGATEELWFPMWEFRGMPWDNPDMYAKWSPSNYVRDFKTPTLIFHGELDYRVPVEQGLQLFTALQMQKVPSKMVLFPDEGHWVLKPQNSMLWYSQFLEWIGEWLNKPQDNKQ
ncbi:MAG: S9 family peptidase [Bryobacteraceae bacterium]|jgi:dipeptidyl aminopeptidase/acylaminoacyl peptidase